jgi:hypothetical protein
MFLKSYLIYHFESELSVPISHSFLSQLLLRLSFPLILILPLLLSHLFLPLTEVYMLGPALFLLLDGFLVAALDLFFEFSLPFTFCRLFLFFSKFFLLLRLESFLGTF